MRYMGFVKMAGDVGEAPPALFEAMGEHVQRGFADGVLVDAGGLYATSCRTELRVRGGQVTSTDGPFAEAKEEVGGYAIIEVRDHAEAVEQARQLAELHRQHWPEWEGAIEVRRIATPDEAGPGDAGH
ncbi:MAG TPA: YciI family protein [Nocardioidaceae bacterium]|nr:YciI family protein [Nocardioidaceae bacterium]